MKDKYSASDFAQVESMIISLYEPNTPEVISQTQANLSLLQNSAQAWPLAHYLLGRPSDKVRFFGALTIIIKLNKESTFLSGDEATELLINLIGWYLTSLEDESGPLVARKLSSAIATFFLNFYRTWPRYLHHLILCLNAHQSLHPDTVNAVADSKIYLETLAPAQLQAALWLSNNVVEEVSRMDLNAAANAGLYDALLQNVTDAVALMARCMPPNALPGVIHEYSIQCLQSWVWFSQRASNRDSHVVESLRLLIAGVIESLPIIELDDASDAAAELLTDSLSTYPSLFTDKDFQSLTVLFNGEWFRGRYQNLIQGDFGFDSVRFGQLLLAFGDARVDVLVKSSNQSDQQVLESLCGLLAAEGCPVIEDRIFVPAIEFWSTFSETMASFMEGDESRTTNWATSALSHIMKAVSNAWRKIICPEDFGQWDSSERVLFSDARKDVIDMLQSVFSLSGSQLAVTFTNLILSSLSSSSWLELEASAFCLAGLADCDQDDVQFDRSLSLVFGSPLFSVLQENRSNIPPKTRQTCLSLIEKYSEYFEKRVNLLPPALSLLFSMLDEGSMATSAAKSIVRLCSSCRYHLHGDFDAFLAQYQHLLSNPQLDCLTSEKIIGAVASIAQAIPTNDLRDRACAQILNLVQEDVLRAKQPDNLISSSHAYLRCRCPETLPGDPLGLHIGLRALRCLVSIARGFEVPSDASIDLESDGVPILASTPGLLQLQGQVMNIMLEIQTSFPMSSEVTELICTVLRSGFSEKGPGPFVLPPKNVAQYLTNHTIKTPRIGLIVSTACSFISSLRSQRLPAIEELLSAVLIWAITLFEQLAEPDLDPELSQNGIDFVRLLFLRSPNTLLQLQPPSAAEYFFAFSLRVLDGKEPLPKASAAEFWCAFVSARFDDLQTQEVMKQAMDTLGPMLSQSLMRNIGGNASRSELDRLSEPLKKLAGRYPLAKHWLQYAVDDYSFPSSKVNAEQKTLFVKKIIGLRGSRATNQVVRDFWLASRGASFAYAS